MIKLIIPYQVITGNYNGSVYSVDDGFIIPYQVITGNYNVKLHANTVLILYHTK